MFPLRMLPARSAWLACLLSLPAAARVAPFHHPHDVVDALAVSPVYSRDPALLVASAGSLNVCVISEDGGRTFEPTRRGMRGLKVHAFAMAPDWDESGRALAATGKPGLALTADRGVSWRHAEHGLPAFHVVYAPGDPGVVYFADLEALYRSADGGNTAQALATAPIEGATIESLAVSSTGAVAAGTSDRRLLLSPDEGATWSVTAVPGVVRSVAFSPAFASDQTLWVGTHGSGVLQSTDGGKTLTVRNEGLDDPDVNDVTLAPGYPEVPHLFVTTRDAGLFRSVDDGGRWAAVPLEIKKTFQTKNHYLSVDLTDAYPEDPTIFCGTFEGLYISRDGGETWQEGLLNPTRMGRKVAFSPDFARDRTIFASGYGQQLLLSRDGGENWERSNTDFDALGCYTIAVAPTYATEPLVILGVGDGVRRSSDGGRDFESIRLDHKTDRELRTSPSAIYTIAYSPAFAEDRLILAGCGAGELFRSEDAGKSWRNVGAVAERVLAIQFSSGFAQDHTVFLGGVGVYRSTDGGETFEGPFLKSALFKSGLIVPDDFPKTGQVFANSYHMGLMRSDDRGEKFRPCSEGLEGHQVSSLRFVADAGARGTLFASTLGGGLYASSDRGKSWQRQSTSAEPFPTIFCLDLSPDFARDHTLMIGGYEGFWRSNDAGSTWTAVCGSEMYDDVRDSWFWTGNWRKTTLKGCINKGASLAQDAGATMSMNFDGHGFHLFGVKGPQYGIAEVLLDGEVIETVDCYADAEETQAELASREGLPETQHTVALRVVGEKNPKATSRKVGIDAVEVLYGSAPPALRGPPSPVIASVGGAPVSNSDPKARTDDGSRSWVLWVVAPLAALVVLRLLMRSGPKGPAAGSQPS